MKNGKIGIQMSTIKSTIAKLGVYDTMAACAQLGYHCMEVSQLPMTAENVDALRRASEDFKIQIAACSAALEPAKAPAGETLATDFDKIVNDCKTLGCSMLRIGMLPIHCMGSFEKSIDFAKRADEMAEKLAEQGIDLYYHNHHIEFVKYEGKYLLDIIRENTSRLGFELDTHWIHRGGEDPVPFIKKFAGRIRLLHLKDYRIGEFQMPEGPFDPKTFQTAFAGVVQFAELGQGSLKLKDCIEAGLEGGSEYFLIEQDDTYGLDPLESLKISRDYLYEIGYKDWF